MLTGGSSQRELSERVILQFALLYCKYAFEFLCFGFFWHLKVFTLMEENETYYFI